MDIAPILYALLTVALVVVVLRLRKVAISNRAPGPRAHRITYRSE